MAVSRASWTVIEHNLVFRNCTFKFVVRSVSFSLRSVSPGLRQRNTPNRSVSIGVFWLGVFHFRLGVFRLTFASKTLLYEGLAGEGQAKHS